MIKLDLIGSYCGKLVVRIGLVGLWKVYGISRFLHYSRNVDLVAVDDTGYEIVDLRTFLNRIIDK